MTKKYTISMALTIQTYLLMILSYFITSILGILRIRKCWIDWPIKYIVQKRKNDIEHSFGIAIKLASRLIIARLVSIMRNILLIFNHLCFCSYSLLGSIIIINQDHNHIKYCIRLVQIKSIFQLSGFHIPFIIYAYNIYNIEMRVCALQNNDEMMLGKVKDVLMTKWVSSKAKPQQISKKIDKKMKGQGSQFIYGVLLNEKEQILIVAALFLQYKMTRGLSQIYHLEIEYKCCSEAQELYFQSQIIHLLPGYKITGLNVTKSQFFPPHQVYMETQLHKDSKMISSL